MKAEIDVSWLQITNTNYVLPLDIFYHSSPLVHQCPHTTLEKLFPNTLFFNLAMTD